MWTIAQLAKETGLSRHQIRTRLLEGKLKAIKGKGPHRDKTYLIEDEEAKRFVMASSVKEPNIYWLTQRSNKYLRMAL